MSSPSSSKGNASWSASTEAAETTVDGVNLVGYLRAESGVGEVGRLMAATLDEAGVPYSLIPFNETRSRQEDPFQVSQTEGPIYDINILCVNADQTPVFADRVGPSFFEKRYSVGVWAWETEEFPSSFWPSASVVDEVWGISTHTASAIAPVVGVPVIPFPLPINPPLPDPVDRSVLGLSEEYTFLFCFDFDSVLQRKNPSAVVEAFRRAFEPGEGPALVLKSINGHFHPEQLHDLRDSVLDRDDVRVVDGYIPRGRQSALVASCDVYVSLHRAEGFGLTIAEAMAFGRPVIATAYSANLDFMPVGAGYSVPYKLVEIPTGCEPYTAGTVWAEPDINAAAQYMRQAWEQPEEARELGERAQAHIKRWHTPAARTERLRRRLLTIKDLKRPILAAKAGPVSRKTTPSPETDEMDPDLVLLGAVARRDEERQKRGPVQRVLRFLLRPARNHLVRLQQDLGALMLADFRERENRLRTDVSATVAEASRKAGEALHQGIEEVRSEMNQLGRHQARRFEHLEKGFELTRPMKDRLEEVSHRLAQTEAAETEHLQEIDRRFHNLVAELYPTPYMEKGVTLRFDKAHECITLHRAESGASLREEGNYLFFEEVFRGAEDFIRERQRIYLDVLHGQEPVLDLGCGRGEMLDLLAAAGTEASGVDSDPGMIARCREKGHLVVLGEGLDALDQRDDASLGAIFSAQVIEHLSYPDLMRLFSLGRQKLRPGGILVLETVNPHSLSALKTFWIDPSHRNPLFPETLLVLAQSHGFSEERIIFPNRHGGLAEDLRTCGEYALIARNTE